MAIDINSARFLMAARKKGVSFDRVVMIGRQNLCVALPLLVQLFERNKLSPERLKVPTASRYSEPLFEALGATQVDSLDNSDFEGAQLVHDMNQPIRAEWKEKYDIVYDGGTLEHIFNFPTALKNSMELVREGGRLFIHTCANNLCGHGFFQFSPELFYRALSAENGFEVERMTLHRMGPYGAWYEVADPNAIRSRVELITFTPVLIMVQAKRVSLKPIFSQPPQQSDYTALWQTGHLSAARPKKNTFPVLRSFYSAMKTGWEFYRRQSLFNRRFFRRNSSKD